MRHDRAAGERGATAVLVAVSLLLLLGFAALALDAGIGYEERRDTQNAADDAALAAAFEACNPRVPGSADPVGVAEALALKNGFDATDPDIVITTTDLGDGFWEVVIATTNPTRFGQASAVDTGELTVISRAVADCEYTPFLGGYAIFADAPNSCTGGVEMDLSGATKTINGDVHSNGQYKITGSATNINGTITSVDGPSGASPPGTIVGEQNDPLEDYVDMSLFTGGSTTISDPSGNGSYAIYRTTNDIDNLWLVSNNHGVGNNANVVITESAVYYTTGDIDLSQVSTDPGVRVTFVADDGQIKVTGSADLRAYYPVVAGPVGPGQDPGLLMFSSYNEPPAGPTCGGDAIQWSLSGATSTGVIYAPYGQAKQSFSSNASINGSIIAYTVELSGSDFTMSYQNNSNVTPKIEIALQE